MTYLRSLPFRYLGFFNSHPPKEDDWIHAIFLAHLHFSTHILPRRMTVNMHFIFRSLAFSTHILPRRMTYSCLFCRYTFMVFNSHPPKEDDMHPIRSTHNTIVFNSHPPKEDDYNCATSIIVATFSTHILPRRMTNSTSCFN